MKLTNDFRKKINTQVNGQRPGQRVHESVAPPVSLSPEADVWDPRVKRVKRKEKGSGGLAYWAKRSRPARVGPNLARFG